MDESTNSYSLFIKCEIDGIEQYLGIDYIDDNGTFTASSDITTHPLVNGDIVADHMYIRASTASYSGSFSLLGNKKGITYISNNEKDVVVDYSEDVYSRLHAIQKIFERINRDGILCTLVKRSENGDESRFSVRENMALTSITWVEHQYSVDFSFEFTQALTASVEQEIYIPTEDDGDLPILTAPVSADLSDIFIDKQEIKEEVKNLISNIELGNEFLWGFGYVFKFLTVNSYKKLKKRINEFKERSKLEDLKNISDEQIDKLVDNILEEFNEIEKKISLLKISQNCDQQCLITIDNTLYCFTFTRSSKNKEYGLSVTHLDVNGNEKEDKIVGNIDEYGITSLGFCSPGTIIFETDKGTQIYIANLYSSQNNVSTIESRRDLRNYALIISNLDLYHYEDLVNAAIEEVFNKL